MKLYVLFSRGTQKKGGRDNCLICLTQYPPLPISSGISNKTTFIVNEEDEYSFAGSDILIKLPSPDCGGIIEEKR